MGFFVLRRFTLFALAALFASSLELFWRPNPSLLLRLNEVGCIGEAIIVRDDMRVQFGAGLTKPDDGALGAAADGAGHVVGGGGVVAGQRPVGEETLGRFDARHVRGERLDQFGRNLGRL